MGSVGSQAERTVYPAPPNAPALRVAPVICYESIYGDFIGEYVRNGATLLGLITNDAWWHDSPGYRQLLQLRRAALHRNPPRPGPLGQHRLHRLHQPERRNHPARTGLDTHRQPRHRAPQ